LNSVHEILSKYWGYGSFRPLQEEIISSLLEGHDTLALMPTGGGKSICFQVPGLVLDGLCLVISPLVALMKDQVHQLTKRGIKAISLTAGMSSREMDIALDNLIYGDFKFLYVSPERLKSELFLSRARKMKISMLAIDEAHCISQWGYDFRPPYLEIAEFRKEFNIDKIIALTATATKEAKEDIIRFLDMKDVKVFSKSFARSNLSYSVIETENKAGKILDVFTNVPGSGVVYVRSRKKTQEIAAFLNQHGISADYYHAGLNPIERQSRQESWIQNKKRVMVATNAFGMGIDKPDVRVVVHIDLPDSLEAYYQEAGRAGRDERKAYAVLLFNKDDSGNLLKRTIDSQVDVDLIRRVYQCLANQYKLAVGSGLNVSYEFDFDRFTKTFDLPGVQTFHALHKLEMNGLIQLNEGFYQPSKLNSLVDHDNLYRFQVANQKYDPIIKIVLRLYGGEIYNHYVTIKESDIARLLNIPKADVHQKLTHLASVGIFDYEESSSQPHIVFTMPRFEVGKLPIDATHLEKRKEIVISKAKSMVGYAEKPSNCRSLMLQAYFDENSEIECGICDYCIHKKKNESLSANQLLETISQKERNMNELIEIFKTEKSTISSLLRRLTDEGKIKYDSSTQLFSIEKGG